MRKIRLMIFITIIVIISTTIGSFFIYILLESNDDEEIKDMNEMQIYVKEKIENNVNIEEIIKDLPKGWEANRTEGGSTHYGTNSSFYIIFQCPSIIIQKPSKPSGDLVTVTLSFHLTFHPRFNESEKEQFEQYASKVANSPEAVGVPKIFAENDYYTVIV